MIDNTRLMESIGRIWDESIVPTLCEYIRIPNKSQAFDSQWAEHGHMDRAAELMRAWCEANALEGMTSEIVRLPGRTPLLFVEIPAANGGRNDDCVLMYGHMDKQPEFTGWAAGLGPWTPVIRNGRLYGRGGADDGYAVFGSVLAVRALRDQGIAHARCVIVIEAGEESSSPDLPAYVDALADRIGKPSLIVCLDAECGNYEQFWCTTSLRGNLVGTLRVEVLKEGVHSGMASGIAPSSFRILRQLLARVEDAATGRILLEVLHAPIPADRLAQARAVAATLGPIIQDKVPLLPGMQPVDASPLELTLNSTWRPTLSVTGADGLPPVHSAGNVLRPMTALVLSLRLPPSVDPQRAAAIVKDTLEHDPPYGAKVSFDIESSMGGWNAPSNAPWLEAAVQAASAACFGADAMYMGTGGSIPFMAMLSEKFPGVQFVVTGVLGPQSNAHGPNEFLDIATGKRVTGCVAWVLAAHAVRN
jgi:acetylornithine deacetylase/succinyl-diaminopimelate desuccinylase-like protein